MGCNIEALRVISIFPNSWEGVCWNGLVCLASDFLLTQSRVSKHVITVGGQVQGINYHTPAYVQQNVVRITSKNLKVASDPKTNIKSTLAGVSGPASPSVLDATPSNFCPEFTHKQQNSVLEESTDAEELITVLTACTGVMIVKETAYTMLNGMKYVSFELFLSWVSSSKITINRQDWIITALVNLMTLGEMAYFMTSWRHALDPDPSPQSTQSIGRSHSLLLQ